MTQEPMHLASERGRASNSSSGVRTAVPVPREVTSDLSRTEVSPAPKPSEVAERRSVALAALFSFAIASAVSFAMPSARSRIAAAVWLPSALFGAMLVLD